jgi:hypothetical protein
VSTHGRGVAWRGVVWRGVACLGRTYSARRSSSWAGASSTVPALSGCTQLVPPARLHTPCMHHVNQGSATQPHCSLPHVFPLHLQRWNIAHNLGGFAAPLVAGGFAKAMGWQWGMWAPGIIGLVVGMLVLLACK